MGRWKASWENTGHRIPDLGSNLGCGKSSLSLGFPPVNGGAGEKVHRGSSTAPGRSETFTT